MQTSPYNPVVSGGTKEAYIFQSFGPQYEISFKVTVFENQDFYPYDTILLNLGGDFEFRFSILIFYDAQGKTISAWGEQFMDLDVRCSTPINVDTEYMITISETVEKDAQNQVEIVPYFAPT